MVTMLQHTMLFTQADCFWQTHYKQDTYDMTQVLLASMFKAHNRIEDLINYDYYVIEEGGRVESDRPGSRLTAASHLIGLYVTHMSCQ